MGKEKTKERIVQAAIKVFSEKGYERSHVEDILNEANVCKGTFYRYFRSKSDLLERACRNFLFDVGGEWYEFISTTDDPVRGLEYHVDFIMTIIHEEKTASTFFELWARGVRSEASRSSSKKKNSEELPGVGIYQMLRENITRFYQAGKERGLLEFDVSPNLMATLLVAVVDGFCIQYMLDPGALDLIQGRDFIKREFIYNLEALTK
jgi:AcrR family transcriptional regulator